EHGRLVLTVSNSPLARAYGGSTKPVCHFLTGWIAGLGRNLLEREVLCEETACAAQAHGRCEFELRPLSPLWISRKAVYPPCFSDMGRGTVERFDAIVVGAGPAASDAAV